MADHLSKIALWDPDELTILVSRDAHPHDLIRELHAILVIDFGAPSIPGAGLLCVCGEPLAIPDSIAIAATTPGASTL
ncbi:hypothetical protein [Streptomyces sp. NBC_00443]|uniref:hypothetical protein n=1 Tax=Streptomyces sp. NBC_00443 TaxID=2975743 RepID=UPI002E1D12BE